MSEPMIDNYSDCWRCDTPQERPSEGWPKRIGSVWCCPVCGRLWTLRKGEARTLFSVSSRWWVRIPEEGSER